MELDERSDNKMQRVNEEAIAKDDQRQRVSDEEAIPDGW